MSDVKDAVRTLSAVLRRHMVNPQPDALKRVNACSCGHWQPGQPHLEHIVDELQRAGFTITKDTA